MFESKEISPDITVTKLRRSSGVSGVPQNPPQHFTTETIQLSPTNFTNTLASSCSKLLASRQKDIRPDTVEPPQFSLPHKIFSPPFLSEAHPQRQFCSHGILKLYQLLRFTNCRHSN